LLFMGEEYGEPAPFQFFSDHIDPKIADATRTGRRTEFAAFTQFSEEEIPDPQDPATFERSKLSRRRDEALTRLYAELLAVRRELPPGVPGRLAGDEDRRLLRVRRGPFELIGNFSSQELRVDAGRATLRLATSHETRLSDDGHLHLAPLSGALTVEGR
jgi:maltooligosyltrehalose trehalohydrolase